MADTLTVAESANGRIELRGPLTFATARSALSASMALLPTAGTVTIDLGGVSHADSAALALLVEWRRAANQRGLILQVLSMTPQLRALAQAAGMEDIWGSAGPAQDLPPPAAQPFEATDSAQ